MVPCWWSCYFLMGLVGSWSNILTEGLELTNSMISKWLIKTSICINVRVSRGFPEMGVPQNGWFVREDPYFRKPQCQHLCWDSTTFDSEDSHLCGFLLRFCCTVSQVKSRCLVKSSISLKVDDLRVFAGSSYFVGLYPAPVDWWSEDVICWFMVQITNVYWFLDTLPILGKSQSLVLWFISYFVGSHPQRLLIDLSSVCWHQINQMYEIKQSDINKR